MPAQSFGPYVLQGLLGRGGMGEVHQAYDTEHNRTVALKLLSAQLASDQDFQERFRREAFLTAGLNEPHVIPIHRYGEIDGRLFLDMRLVDGESLDARLERQGALEPAEALAILDQIASALDAAHSAHLVHRDVKPSNILLTGRPNQPFAYLVDFGIARSMSDDAGPALTQTGSAVGTFDYMAPERFLQEPVTPAVDVYALACVLYECVTGRKPFTGDTLPALLYAALNTQAVPPSRLVPHVPAALDAVLARGLAKDPKQRPATAGAFIDSAWDATRSAPSGRRGAAPTVVGTTSPPEPPGPVWTNKGPDPRPRQHIRAVAVALIAVAVLAVAGVAVVLSQTLGGGAAPVATGTADSGTSTRGSATTSGAAPTTEPAAGDTAPNPSPTPAPAGDEHADGAAGNCFNGILSACDSLFDPDVPAGHAMYGSTCGGRAPETRGACFAHFLGEPDPPTGLGNEPKWDAVAQDCFNEDWAACDTLWRDADVSSFYYDYGRSCGGRLPDPLVSYGDCERGATG